MESLILQLQSAVDARDITAAREISLKLVNGNVILPLLSSVQNPTSPAVRKDALSLLKLLVRVSHLSLSECGWNVVGRGDNTGSYVFKNRHSGQITTEPAIKQSWQHDLIDALSVLIYPGEGHDGRQLWAVSVTYHSISLGDALNRALAAEPGATDAANTFSVIDVYKVYDSSEEGATDRGTALRRGGKKRHTRTVQPRWCIVRQLIQGVWQGPNCSPSMEVTHMSPLPSSFRASQSVAHQDTAVSLTEITSVETWHETTACAMALCGVAMGQAQSCSRHLLLEGVSLLVVADFLCSVLSCVSPPPTHLEPTQPVHPIQIDITRGVQSADAGRKVTELFTSVNLEQYCGQQGEAADGCLLALCQNFIPLVADNGSPATHEPCSLDAIVLEESACTGRDLVDALSKLKSHGTLSIIVPVQRRVSVRERLCAALIAFERCPGWTVFELRESGALGHVTVDESLSGYVVLVCWPAKEKWGPTRLTTAWWQRTVETLDIAILHRGSSVSAPDQALAGMPLSMDVFAAQRTRAVLVPQFLIPWEAAAIHNLAGKRFSSALLAGASASASSLPAPAKHLGREIRSSNSQLWEVLFLQTNAAFSSSLPGILDKAIEVVRRIDREEGWGLLSTCGPQREDLPFSVRVLEYHTQIAPSEALGDTRHYDQDSLITLDILLSDPLVEFKGGDIQTLEKKPCGMSAEASENVDYSEVDEDVLIAHNVQQFDALCFVSHKYHCVRPLLSGRRVVCVIEFWRGSISDRSCPHRCLTVRQNCPWDNVGYGDRTQYDTLQETVAVADMRPDTQIRIPFRLAAISSHAETESSPSRTDEPNTEESLISTVQGGVLGVLWQAAIAEDGVDDRGVLIVKPLDETTSKEIENMFGSSSDEDR